MTSFSKYFIARYQSELDERRFRREESKVEINKLNRLYKASEEAAEKARIGMFISMQPEEDIEFVPLSGSSDDVKHDAPKLRNWSGVAMHGYSSLSGEWAPLPASSTSNLDDAKTSAPVWRGRSSGTNDEESRRRFPKEKGTKLFSTGLSRQAR
jgi:hypothetical protein